MRTSFVCAVLWLPVDFISRLQSHPKDPHAALCTMKDDTDTTERRPSSADRPNIIIILADDLGFSDVGCFGSEIATPHIDSLAYGDGGMRFTQMYNCARCCPSRASLLTGAYPHRAGIGHMVYDAGVGPEYQGYLRKERRRSRRC